jgi:hypothetical protein
MIPSNHLNNNDFEAANKYLATNVMQHFSPEFITSIIDEKFATRDKLDYGFSNNAIELLEANYISVLQQTNSAELAENRIQTYKNIINKIADYNKININQILLNDPDTDLYAIAKLLYELLVLGYRDYLLIFMTNFIMNEINNLYNIAELSECKKNKDVTTVSLKKQYSGKKLPYIVANLDKIIQCIPYNYTLTLSSIISYIMPERGDVLNTLNELIDNDNNFFVNNYVNSMLYGNFKVDILVGLKLELNNKINLIENNTIKEN